MLTNWISCATPPVRDGEYDLSWLGDTASPFRALYCAGKWRNRHDGSVLDAVPSNPYEWRGLNCQLPP